MVRAGGQGRRMVAVLGGGRWIGDAAASCHDAGMAARDGDPLLVFGPRSATYDFGPSHPLTPRRFGPGIDLLRRLGAEPGLAPEPASDEDLLLAHTRRYLATVRRFSEDRFGPPEAGIGPGDDPPFAGMHEAAASVAGGSLRAIEAILRGDVVHAIHPGGGLHHAMPDRASGFCIYDDPALAIARVRQAGLRVLYVDLDVHHGDGVEAIHRDDPGVLTLSFHESTRYLFPYVGGRAADTGVGVASGSVVNVPLEPPTGEAAWLAAVEQLLPELAATFRPDVVVSQHGADSHAWDPLAHLLVTTTAMGAAARLVDRVAHRWAGGRWLATGGGGYDAYRVVPRAWALTWLAAAHRDVPEATPADWRDRWADEAARHRQAPLPVTFADPPNAGLRVDAEQAAAEEASRATLRLVRQLVVPAVIREARDRGWLDPLGEVEAEVGPLAASVLPLDERLAATVVERARASGATVVERRADGVVVGVAIAVRREAGWELVALGVGRDLRHRGIARSLIGELVDVVRGPITATVSLAERDPLDPLPREVRSRVARRLLEGAGFEVRRATGELGLADPEALVAHRS